MATPKAPRAGGSEKTQATLDALVRGGLKKPVAPLPAFIARRPAEEDSGYAPSAWDGPAGRRTAVRPGEASVTICEEHLSFEGG